MQPAGAGAAQRKYGFPGDIITKNTTLWKIKRTFFQGPGGGLGVRLIKNKHHQDHFQVDGIRKSVQPIEKLFTERFKRKF